MAAGFYINIKKVKLFSTDIRGQTLYNSQFINDSTKALDIMWRKMGRTIIKAHKDLMERGEINIHRYIK